MQPIEEYLGRATLADEASAKARDVEVKRDWRRIADQWRAMARQAGHIAADVAERAAEPAAATDGAATVLLDGDDAFRHLTRAGPRP
jgi:hypothetical protein